MNVFKNITAIFLSLMICYTSSGFNLFIHFCGGKIYTLSLSQKDATCGMEKTDCQSISLKYSNHVINAANCCNNSLVKNKTKITTYEKVNYSPILAQTSTPNFYLIFNQNNSFCRHVSDFEDINSHFLSSSLPHKETIYLANQNFRI